nr:hypothetical protein [Xylella fastidiosa]
MERKSYKKTTLATLISVLLMGSAGAAYANSPSISEKLDLATQHLDGAASTGQAISSDGKTIATSSNNRAFLLSGDNWATKTELGSLKSDSSGASIVVALSSDGKIAAGQSSIDSRYSNLREATIWSGDNWATKTDLGTIRSDNLGVIWSGDNWATKTDLGTIREDGSGNSAVYALSANGKIAVGYADSDIESPNYTNKPVLSKRAIVWSGDNWATKTDLGTLRSDNLGQANANAISADGKIIGGQSYSDIIGTNYNSK